MLGKGDLFLQFISDVDTSMRDAGLLRLLTNSGT